MHNQNKNQVEIVGTVAVGYALDHIVNGKRFYSTTVRSNRNSGVTDYVPVIISENMIVSDGRIRVSGELRTYNTEQGHLKVYVYAESISPSDDKDKNICDLQGILCSIQPLRKTISGHYICKAVIAINRSYGKSSYIPCVAWNDKALKLSICSVGACVAINGRIQSRLYLKEEAHFTCYELSINSIEEVLHER